MRRLLGFLLRIAFVTPILRFLNRRKITVLMMHGVAADREDDGWQPLWPRLTPARLDLVLGQLARHYRFISLDEAVDVIAGRKAPPRNGLVLTFDDGYRNNVTEALPVLQKHAAPAAFFIATGFVETRESYWIDRLDYALQQAPEDARLIEALGRTYDLRNLDRAALAEGYRRLRLGVKNSVPDDAQMLAEFDRISSELEKAAGTSIRDVIDVDRYVAVATWEQLASVAADGVEIGSHTVNHCRLTGIDHGEVAKQLAESKQTLEQKIGKPCRHFCYPNGDHDPAVAALVDAAGYASAVTTDNGLNRVGDNLMTLRRYPMPSGTDAFSNLLAVSGFAELPVIRSVLSRL